MLLVGHSAASVARRLGISSPKLLYRWKQLQLRQGGLVASSLDERVRELEAELLRVRPMLALQGEVASDRGNVPSKKPRFWQDRSQRPVPTSYISTTSPFAKSIAIERSFACNGG
jgi:transposase